MIRIKREVREWDGKNPLVPPEVIERIALGPPPKRAMWLKWFKKKPKK